MATARAKDYAEYYNPSFVSSYDSLVGWSARRRTEGRFFLDLLNRFKARSVLDAACGTGYHALELAAAGFDVVASDGASNMVAKAAENFAAAGRRMPLVQADWRALEKALDRRFDAVLCVGDSFSHLFEESDRRQALTEFTHILMPAGVLIIDHRNYEPVLKRGRVDPTKQNYCCCGDNVKVQLDLVDESVVQNQYKIEGSTHTLCTYPMRSLHMKDLLREAGFSAPIVYGDYKEAFDQDEIEFFVYAARRE